MNTPLASPPIAAVNLPEFVPELQGTRMTCFLFSLKRGRFGDFCRKLLHEVPSVSLWAADMKDNDIPDCLQREEMTTMLRCPPVIHREVGRSDLIGVNSPKY